MLDVSIVGGMIWECFSKKPCEESASEPPVAQATMQPLNTKIILGTALLIENALAHENLRRKDLWHAKVQYYY